MANTVNKNLIVPEIYSELVRAKISGAARIAAMADNLGNLNRQPGETVNFPVWAYIGDASDIEPGTAMDSVQLEQKNSTATVKMVAAKGVKVYDYDDEVALGRAIDEAAAQQGIAIARKIDTDLIADAASTVFKAQLATAGELTQEEVLSGIQLYGDELDVDQFSAIVLHSCFMKSLYSMEGFSHDYITFANANNGIVINGIAGYFLGIPVIFSDRLYDTTNQEGYGLIIKKHSLGFMPKEEPFVETARDASTRSTTIYTSQIYATKLIDESGVVLLKHTVSTSTTG